MYKKVKYKTIWAAFIAGFLAVFGLSCVSSDVFAGIKAGTASFSENSEDTRDFLGIPPFLDQARGKPSVILKFDVTGDMLNAAYESQALRGTANGFNPLYADNDHSGAIDQTGEGYYGYFDPTMQYQYDSINKLFFENQALRQGDEGAWDGHFLNWLSMRRIDIARKIMVGGKVRRREGELIFGSKMWVLEGEQEYNSQDNLNFQYLKSRDYSPIKNNKLVTIESGEIRVADHRFNIRVAVSKEPKGLVQNNSTEVNFGLSVNNFDHKVIQTSNIVNSQKLKGQTMHPCYPIFDEQRLMARAAGDRSGSGMLLKNVALYNGFQREYLCIPTSVHAPNDNIVQVIEEYPMLWGAVSEPESMIDIGHYIQQELPEFARGNDPFGVYSIDNKKQNNLLKWNPYYDAEQKSPLACKNVSVFDFNNVSSANDYTFSVFDPEKCPISTWGNKAICLPDTVPLMERSARLYSALQVAINDLSTHTYSGASASINSMSRSGEGLAYKTSFTPFISSGVDVVTWVGDVSALMIDSQGRFRSDNGDGVLENTKTDPIYDSCYDQVNKQIRVKFSFDDSQRPTPSEVMTCSASGVFNKRPEDVGYLWQAKNTLSDLTNTEAREQRTAYSSPAKNRYIRTNIYQGELGNGTLKFVEKDFVPDTFSADQVGLLNTNNLADAKKLVNFIRGVDQEGMRSRKLDGATLRLGDVIYSSPVPVGRPAENLHLLYDDVSYRDFFKQYRDRRTIVYVGGNDGMLHAFNGGWYDKKNAHFKGSKESYTKWDLGQETWAFVPYNLLPHLHYLSKKTYGLKEGDHTYFVDQKPYVFDAQIFGAEGLIGQPDSSSNVTTHPNGWGTILVAGFRSGGGQSEIFPNPGDTDTSVTVRPAYLIFDITDPEQAPKLLTEFSHKKLGATMSVPTGLSIKNTSGTSDWYLVMGSGPSANKVGHQKALSEQNAQLLMLNLKTLNLEKNFGVAGVMDLGEGHSFVGDLSAFDANLDASTDAIYFGTTQTDKRDDLGGKLFRLRVVPGAGVGFHRWKADVMFDANAAIVTGPQLSLDKNGNRWVHVGTGRYMTKSDTKTNNAMHLYGLKEPRNSQGEFEVDTYSTTPRIITPPDLVDVSGARVSGLSGALNNTVWVSPPLRSDTVESLEQRQVQYSDASLYTSGWQRKMSVGERVMGKGLVLGGVYSQSTYTPEAKVCSVSGDAKLYAMRYTTGTAWYQHIFANSVSGNSSANDEVIDVIEIGSSPSLSPRVHLGEKRNKRKVTIMNTNSNTSMTINIEQNLKGIHSKTVSWREL